MNSVVNITMDGQEMEITMRAYDLLIEKAYLNNDELMYKYGSKLKKRFRQKKMSHHREWARYFKQREVQS